MCQRSYDFYAQNIWNIRDATGRANERLNEITINSEP